MAAVTNLPEEKQTFKMPNDQFNLKFPEPFFFIVKATKVSGEDVLQGLNLTEIW